MAPKSGIQVLHLSMPRTGSASMKAAYEQLGLPAYHGFDFFQRPHDQMRFSEAFAAKHHGKGKPYGRKEFDELLVGWAAVSDSPVLGFIDELIEAYPEAKVVLVHRDLDKWEKSFQDTVIASFCDWKTWAIIHLIEPFQTIKLATLTKAVLLALYDAHDEASWRRNLRPTYRAHAARLRARIPRHRLLEYDLGSGWEPLCAFLGKEVPKSGGGGGRRRDSTQTQTTLPFPHLNETKDFQIFLNGFKREKLMLGCCVLAGFAAVLAVLLAVGNYFWMMVTV